MTGDCGHGWGYHNDGPSGSCYKCLENEENEDKKMENKCNECCEEFEIPKQEGEEFVCPYCGSLEWDTNLDE